MRKQSTWIGLVVVVGLLGLVGCTSNNSITAPEGQTPPSLPAINTMAMDLGLFESAQVSPQAIERGTLAQPAPASPDAFKLNFLNAAVRVLYLEVVVYSALVHPVAAFATAIHSVPQYQASDSSWLWTYIFVDDDGIEYSVFLSARELESTIAWRLEVSSNDPALLLDHFVWFDGEVQKDEKSGYWQFYEPVTGVAAATDGIPSIRIDWEDRGFHDGRLALLVNKPDVPENGSTLTFDETPAAATVEFFDAVNSASGTIDWSRDGSGSIEWPDYNDGVKGCWDIYQRDVDCS